MELKKENSICESVIGAAIEVHRELGGPGLLESVYEEAFVYEMESNGLNVRRQLQVPIRYKSQSLANPLRLDLLIEDKVIIEVKAVAELNTLFKVQLLTYLRLMKLRIGLVINFGQARLIDGVARVINRTN